MNEAIQRAKEFLDRTNEIRQSFKMSIDKKIAEELDMDVSELRKCKRMANAMLKADMTVRANEMKRSGYSESEIAKLFDVNESYIRYALGQDEDVARAAVEIYAKKLGYAE